MQRDVKKYLDVTQKRISSDWHIPQASERYLRMAGFEEGELVTYGDYVHIPLKVAGATCTVQREPSDPRVPYTPKEAIRIATYVRGLPQQAMRWFPANMLTKYDPKKERRFI